MCYVYLIDSVAAQGERYLGITTDLKARLEEHDAGRSFHTSKFKPWELITYIAFTDRANAEVSSDISNLVQGMLLLVSGCGNSLLPV